MLRLRFFDAFEQFSLSVLGPLYRRVGKSLAYGGLSLQLPNTSDDRLVPSLRRVTIGQRSPSISSSEFIAPNSVIIGEVSTKEGSSIWYGATLRGEIGRIEVGKQTVIQDLANIEAQQSATNIVIGDNVVIGPNAFVAASKIGDNAFIGMGSTVSQGSSLSSNAVLTAGAVLPPNSSIPSNQIWAGNPAVYLRDITPEERQVLSEHHQESVQLARIHAEETEKGFREVLNDMDRIVAESQYDHEAQALQKMRDLGFPMEGEEDEYIEQRIFMKEKSAPLESEFWKKNYDPYEQDLFHFPDSFKAYQQQYSRYDEAKKYFEQNPNVEATIIDREFQEPTQTKPWTRKY